MNPKNLRVRLLLAPLLASGLFLAFGEAAAQENSCATAECHAKLLKPKNVHPATDACDSCHEAVATPHPQAGKKTFKLAQALPELCSTCHDPFGKKADVHPPVKDGDCTTCHDPHASDEAKLLTSPVKDLCETCHSDHVEFKVLHGPVSAGDCTACHNPHESDIKPLLVKQAPDLCFDCHGDIQDVLKKKDVHPAIDAGCTTCHNPHGSAHPKLLSDEGQALCFQCHDTIAETVQKAAVPHAALTSANGCTSCHSPHASDNEKLLLNPQKQTCLSCHKNVVTKNMTQLHGPINDGKCTACHVPHGGQYRKLLMQDFPQDPYVPYTDTAFALCFSCHNRDLLQYPDTSFATNFRDGDRNLHYLHVNRQKGRSCRMCHAIHGSAGPKLVAESVAFGKWNLPLKFVKTETGGGCSPGCHRPAAYDRKRPGKKPEPTKTPG
jgi:predicted CXXCH cytochrome family protein